MDENELIPAGDNHNNQIANPAVSKLEQILGEDSTDKAFKAQDLLNALRMIICADKNIEEMVFRYKIPSREFAVAVSSLWKKYKRHNHTDGMFQILLLLGFLSAVNADRIKDLVSCVIGQAKQTEAQEPGEKFKRWAQKL